MKKHTDILENFSQCKTICRNFPYPVIVVDSDGIILDGCDDIGKVLGKTIEEMKGNKIIDLPIFTKSGIETLKKLIKEAFHTNESSRSELTVRINDIETAMEVTANMVEEGGEKLLFLIFHDVTCIRTTQKELEESRLRYRTLFENMRSGVAVYQAVDNGK